MAHPNEELLRRGYDAFNKGDLDFLRNEVFSEDVIARVPGRSQIAGEYKGIDQVFGLFGKLAELSGGTFKADPHDILANDEHGVALSLTTAEREGKKLDQQRTMEVYHFRGGKIFEFWPMVEDDYENDEFWS